MATSSDLTSGEWARRLAVAAVVLSLVPALFEAITVDPRLVAERGSIASAMPHLVLTACIPYFLLAVSCAALSIIGIRSADQPTPRGSWFVFGIGTLLVCLAAANRPTAAEVLLGSTGAVLEGDVVRMGMGPLGFRTQVEPVPLERLGHLGSVVASEVDEAHRVTVRLYAQKLADVKGQGRIEIVGMGTAYDVTERFSALALGESRLFEFELPITQVPARVSLRLAAERALPVVFFDRTQTGTTAGLAIESGGGNHAHQAHPSDATRLMEAQPPLIIEGEQAGGGYTVVALSGVRWDRHDLRGLSDAGGVLDLVIAHSQAPWSVRFVSQGVESALMPLASFDRTALGHDRTRYRLPLSRVEWRSVPKETVVGVALVHDGPAGPFRLALDSAQVRQPEYLESGLALLALSSSTPGGAPVAPLMAAGKKASLWIQHQTAMRFVAGVALLFGLVGVSPLFRAVRMAPVDTVCGLLAGPFAVWALDALLPLLIVSKPEHLGVALVGVALTGAAIAHDRLGIRVERPDAVAAPPAPTLRHLDALKTLAMLGIIGMHVTADPAGAAYGDYPEAQRLVATVGRALMTPFDIGIFVAGSLFLLAHSLEHRQLAYQDQIGRWLRRLFVPFVAWSLFYLAFRYLKAFAFGYLDAYRLELSQLASWMQYAILGSAQYHLYYLPFLALLVLAYPLYRPARKNPVLGVGIVLSLLAWFALDRMVYADVHSLEARLYVLRATKAVGYVGYGFLAFALYGVMAKPWSQRARRIIVVIASAVLVVSMPVLVRHAVAEATTGRWLTHDLAAHLARHLAMGAAFVLFVFSSHVRWVRWLTALGPLTFGVYLLHPAVLDLLEIAERNSTLGVASRVGINFAIVTVLSFAVVAGLRRIPRLCWMVGSQGGNL